LKLFNKQTGIGLTAIAFGFLIFIVVNIIPIETMLINWLESTAPVSPDSQWNNLENGRSLWNSIKDISNISALFLIIGGFWFTLKSLRKY